MYLKKKTTRWPPGTLKYIMYPHRHTQVLRLVRIDMMIHIMDLIRREDGMTRGGKARAHNVSFYHEGNLELFIQRIEMLGQHYDQQKESHE